MIFDSKYFLFDPKNDSLDNYYGLILNVLEPEACIEITGLSEDVSAILSLTGAYFDSFQEWCSDMYELKKSDNDQAYFFFHDILIQFKVFKETHYYEEGNDIFYKTMKVPISQNGNKSQRAVCILYKYLNYSIDCIEKYVSKLKPVRGKEDIEKRGAINHTFRSKSKSHGFNVKNQECLKDAYNQLKHFDIVSNDTSYFDFEKTFLGNLPEKKIVWLKGPGALAYFIKEINGQGVRDQKKNIWETTINCFSNSKGRDFTIKQLRHSKTPKGIGDILKVIKTFNEGYLPE